MTVVTGTVLDVYFEDYRSVVMLRDQIDIIHKIYCDNQMLSQLIDDSFGLIGNKVEYDDKSNHIFLLKEGVK